MTYTIQRTQFEYNAIGDPCLTRDETLPGEYADPNKANSRIMELAEVWRNSVVPAPPSLIQHHAGQSVVFFRWGYFEYTRSGDIHPGL